MLFKMVCIFLSVMTCGCLIFEHDNFISDERWKLRSLLRIHDPDLNHKKSFVPIWFVTYML